MPHPADDMDPLIFAWQQKMCVELADQHAGEQYRSGVSQAERQRLRVHVEHWMLKAVVEMFQELEHADVLDLVELSVYLKGASNEA